MRCPDGTEVAPFPFKNQFFGFSRFWKSVQYMKKAQGLTHVIVGIESTGCYGIPFLHFLKDKDVELVYVNPSHTKKVKEVQNNSPNKTDKKDPKVIADIIELGRWLRVVIAKGVAAELRELIHSREDSMKERTVHFNKIYDHMFKIFPEFEQVMKDLKTKTAQYMLQHYPTPESIVELGVTKLATIMHQISRGRIGTERAKQLYAGARESVGIKEGRQYIIQKIEHIFQIISSYNHFIDQYERDISIALQKVPESKYIISIKGIGEITTAAIIGEIADFGSFSSYEEVEKYAGLNLFEISSGKHRGQKRISKRGRPLIRKALFFAAINVVRKGGIYHDKYQSYLDSGMVKMKALVAISRKLLRLIYVLVKNHNEFDITYFKKRELLKAA
jgi:transposase